MKFALKKQEITPDQPVFLAGFGGRTEKSEGVLDDIFVKTALLQWDTTVCVITFDALGGDRSFVDGIKGALKERLQLQEEEIIINFSHTHCSVFLTGEKPDCRRGNYSIGQSAWPENECDVDYSEDIRFFRELRQKIVTMVENSFATMQEGTISIAAAASDAAVSRRLVTDDGVKMRPNFDEEINKDLTVIKLVDLNNHVQGILFSYSCHPTCYSKNMISAEFPGRACAYLEARYPGATALFLQGFAGDIKHSFEADSHFKICSAEEMQQLGDRFGEEVSEVIETGGATGFSRLDKLQTKMIRLRLFTERRQIADLEQELVTHAKLKYRCLAIRRVIAAINAGKYKTILPYSITIWNFGPGITWIAMEGEVVSGYALAIKRLLSDRQVMTLGYSNGVPTYIPTRKVLAEGGYEADAYVLHGFSGPFVPENEDIILGAIAREELLIE